MGIIDTIIVLAALVVLGILVVLISKQRDNLLNELFREKQENIVQWKTLVKDFNKHFNQFAKDNKDITLEQFIEKYSKELSASEKITEELANILLNKLSSDIHKALKELDDHTAQFSGGMPIDDYVGILKTSRNAKDFNRKLKKYIKCKNK